MPNQLRKIILSFVLAGLIGFYFVSPASVDKADAFLGIADVGFQTTIGDIPRYLFQIGETIAKAGLRKLKKRMLTQIQNDLVNWVQNGGEPRFIKHPLKFLENAGKDTVARTIDDVFSSNKIDICSPFKASVQFLVTKPTLLREESLRCSFSDMKENIEKFANNFEDGGWTTWLKLHETRNTLPGSYLGVSQLVNEKRSQGQTVAAAKISATGFLDQKKCSKAKFPKYNLEFTEKDGTIREIDLSQEDIAEAADFNIDLLNGDYNYSWENIWSEINVTTPLDQIEKSSIHLVPTGENFPPISLGPPPRDTPPGAICIEEEVITPGSVVGQWVGGGLEKLGIDNIVNAKEIGEILDAVIDTAVNRAAREGLSYMKSGRGSHTTPFNDRQVKVKNQELSGLESADAVSLQNQLIDLRNTASKSKIDIRKLAGKEDKTAKFSQRLTYIAGYYDGDSYRPGPLLTGETIRTKDTDKKFSDVADRFFSRYNSALFYETSGTYVTFPDISDFTKEENNPGVYIANREILNKLSDIWKAISSVFSELSNNIKECKDVQYTLEPEITEGKDKLPFTDSNGVPIHWSSHEQSYVTRINAADIAYIPAENVKLYMTSESASASIKSDEYKQQAGSYDSLTGNTNEIIKELDSDIDFVALNMPAVLTYTSILLNYDSIGSKHQLIKKIKDYNEIIGNKNKTYTDPATGEVLTHQDAVEKIYKDLISARSSTFNDLLASASEDKREIVKQAKSLIESSLLPDPDEETPKDGRGNPLLQTDNLGIKTSEAVAEAMNINIAGLISELEDRQVKIGRQQTDISNRLGKFLEDAEQRKQAALEGGDSEWEKQFKNRMQLVYASFIYDFYKNRFVSNVCK